MLPAERFVDQVVPSNDPAIFVTAGQFLPQNQGLLVGIPVDEEAGDVLEGVVNMCAGLSAGGSVQIQKYIKIAGLAPIDAPIQKPEPLFDEVNPRLIFHQDPPVDGDAYRVESVIGNGLDVGFADEIFAETIPKGVGIVGAAKLADQAFKPSGAIVVISFPEGPHIPLAQEPVAKGNSQGKKFLTTTVDQPSAIHL